MPLTVPPWIQKAGVADSTRKFKWGDPWECRYEISRLQNKISILWSRPILAVAAGFAEWIIWRFSKVTKDPVFLQFLEAVWAAVVDRRYLNHVSPKFGHSIRKSYSLPSQPQSLDDMWDLDNDYSDPVRGPQCVALYSLAEAADRTAPNDFGGKEAIFLSNLVEQVLGKGEPFKTWRRGVITRLRKYYADDGEQESCLGPPVPREALDLDMKYQPDLAPPLLDKFLASLDHRKNPFLVSPEQMLKLGFEGTPYKYS